MRHLIFAVLIAFFGTVAAAHSPLETTVPANEAQLQALPEQLTLTFRGKIRLTRVTCSLAGGEEVDLDLGDQGDFVNQYDLPLQDMGAGVYTIVWRGLGEDGHAQTGEFSFTVQ